MRVLLYPQTDVFLVLARIGSWTSYEHVEDKWAPEIKHHCPGVPFLIVGVGSHDDDELLSKSRQLGQPGKREDYTLKGHDLAKDLRAVKHIERNIYVQWQLKEVFDEMSDEKSWPHDLFFFYLLQSLIPVFINAFLLRQLGRPWNLQHPRHAGDALGGRGF